MTNANPEPYSERVRLAEIIADARKLLKDWYPAEKYAKAGLAVRCGQLEATLRMLADSAEIVASEKPEG